MQKLIAYLNLLVHHLDILVQIFHGKFVNKVRKNPYSIILFDEIEKAHSNIYNLLLQLFDKGTLTDSMGREINFKNTICIMTSNVGANKLMNKNTFGFASKKDEEEEYENFKKDIYVELEKTFSIEFLNRIDDIIVFNKLSKANAHDIVLKLLGEITQKLKTQNINIKFTEEVINSIVQEDFNDKYGARQLKRKIKNKIEVKIADFLLAKKISKEMDIVADYINGKIKIKEIKKRKKQKELV